MINPFTDVNWQPDLAERRKFGRSLVIGFPCVGLALCVIGWLKYSTWSHNSAIALRVGIIGATAGILFWLIPQVAKPFYQVWYFISCCMGFVIGNLLFSIFFLVFFTLFGLLKRSFGNTQISKTFNKNVSSYWRDVKPITDLRRYYRQY